MKIDKNMATSIVQVKNVNQTKNVKKIIWMERIKSQRTL